MHGNAYQYLLDLNGWTISVGPEGKGFSCSIRAEKQQNDGCISYALVLNDPWGNRILGYDNSHGFDHFHHMPRGKKRSPYNFTTGEVLFADFFARVDEFFAQEISQ